MKFNTALLHGNYKAEEKTGATNVPIYQSTAFAHGSAEELENIFNGRSPGFVYTRLNNPTIESLERRLAYLEGGAGAVACASGMTAVTLAVLNILQSGQEIVAGSGIFGGTFSLFKGFEDFGIRTRYAEQDDLEHYAALINERTRLIFVETIGNPKLNVPDLQGLAELAHSRGIPLLVDNTATTPYLLRPLAWGADIVIHSTSKYINGSSNSIGGVIVDKGKFSWDPQKYPALQPYKKFGPFTYLAKLRKTLFKDYGACMAPLNAFLTTLGLETLGLRMERLCGNTLSLAQTLARHPKITAVNYPGLAENPAREIAARQFDGKFGAILTVRLGTKEKAFQVINALRYAANLSNIGDVRTLVIHPASTIYAENTIEEREKMGVYEDLIRVSVGLEDIEDLEADFAQALEKI